MLKKKHPPDPGDPSQHADLPTPLPIPLMLSVHTEQSFPEPDPTPAPMSLPDIDVPALPTQSDCTTDYGERETRVPFALGDPPPAPERVVVVAVFALTAREPDDLSLVKGEQYIVLDDSQDHWWQVKNSTMDVGFIPSKYVKKLARERKRQ